MYFKDHIINAVFNVKAESIRWYSDMTSTLYMASKLMISTSKLEIKQTPFASLLTCKSMDHLCLNAKRKQRLSSYMFFV